MRIIKFRVWDILEKKFCPAISSGLCLSDFTNTIHGELIACAPSEPDEYITQQFTGLKDKTGREIYEGDIVKFKWINPAEELEETQGEVFWDEQMAMFSFDRSFNFAMNDSCFLQETLEVMGNIFEK